ncbi:MAG: polyprenyl synthetase family protein [Firmicutes bacterium]|nr:polyprenyl synthetase family protein [Bacillota bacterium]MBQ6606173.1 polyprenyl synthetase family protein [Bacillota bacterium]
MRQISPEAAIYFAMRYSLFGGGKRLRPALFFAALEACGAKRDAYLDVAAALEMIHTASLIHDDMPEMDDDDLRRGRPSCHKVYGPAMALLAGDGLFIHAFAVLSRPLPGAAPERQLAAVREIALRSGLGGMVAGQAAEWDNMTRPVDQGLLEYISRGKTSALLIAAVKSAGLLAGADEEKLQALEDYGLHAGLAFQIIDDVLDVEGDDATLGKPAGSDEERGLVTFASLLGCAEARRQAETEAEAALSALSGFGPEADTLRAFPPFFVSRRH